MHTLACCALTTTIASAELNSPPQPLNPSTDYALPGQLNVSQHADDMINTFGCKVHYEQHLPVVDLYQTGIILSHGFMRKLKHMRGWAQHWASWGLSTTVVSLCNSTLLNGHHQRNSDDLRRLAEHLYPGKPVIFAGFSAGGLAAWLAASTYHQSAGYLGLDPVDSGKLAQRHERGHTLPALVLYARPSMCNARNNFLPSIKGLPSYTIVMIAGASHCHFENPYDPRCAWICGGPVQQHTNDSIKRDVLARTTGWLRAQSEAQHTDTAP